jgi:tetratricopeptide (TPR) repeat protein
MTQAIECQKKALQIAKAVHGSDSFTTMECYLNLANNLESQGFKEEADDMYKECMSNFDKKDAEMKQYDQDNDFNGSVNSGENMSQKLMLQQQRLFGGFNQSIKEKDASVIQRIGIYFRQR